ncbi:hypothetical protein KC19_12G112600 [Ceratodon purpureus]|uniref:Uncharacterized protein n=1 Tax=Ceratodon purpureus TaxID=3225 RepID=A0A8T0G9N9_CERPU|nr:hypothetical protein KC19_12G112600 [Ceratodon purpureus]
MRAAPCARCCRCFVLVLPISNGVITLLPPPQLTVVVPSGLAYPSSEFLSNSSPVPLQLVGFSLSDSLSVWVFFQALPLAQNYEPLEWRWLT